MATVLLTDPTQRASLASARALARAGHRVITIGTDRGLAGTSRATSTHVTIAEPDASDRQRFVQAIAAAVRDHRVDVVIPVTDFASRILLGAQHEIGAVVAGPSVAAYERASDKEALLKLAAECGIETPKQVVLAAPGFEPSLISNLRFPIVAKPSRSVVDIDGDAIRQGVQFIATEMQLSSYLDSFPGGGYPLLLQERTIGPGVGVFMLRDRGNTLLNFGHLRLREKPPAGGVSTYREAIVPPPALVKLCERLLDALDYNGAAMIEFKQDAETGTYVLMEINARLWGSLQLAVDAGLDFPSMLVAMALGQPLPAAMSVRAGVRTYWELGELDHAIAIARRSREQLHAPAGMKLGLGAAVRALADRRFADHAEVFRWSDPKPFLTELARWLRNR